MATEIQKKINKNGLVIGRIPDWVKEEIYQEANWHSDDYGEAIAQFVRESIEYRLLKQKFFSGDMMINLSQIKQPKEEVVIKMANGKIIKKEAKNE